MTVEVFSLPLKGKYDDGNWRAEAACKGTPTSEFFPEGKRKVSAEVKALCASCTVRQECLTFAVTEHIQFGVWGGIGIRKRRALSSDVLDGGDE